MRDTAMRIRLVKERVHRAERRRAKRQIGALSAVCAAFSVMLAVCLRALTVGVPYQVAGLCGAVLLHQDAGGYVLVGVLSFAAAAALTLVCIHLREASQRRNRIRPHPPEQDVSDGPEDELPAKKEKKE